MPYKDKTKRSPSDKLRKAKRIRLSTEQSSYCLSYLDARSNYYKRELGYIPGCYQGYLLKQLQTL